LKNKKWGGYREGSGRTALSPSEKKKCVKVYINDDVKEDIKKYGRGNSFSEKVVDLVLSEMCNRKRSMDFEINKRIYKTESKEV